jgi:hypothetical protein
MSEVEVGDLGEHQPAVVEDQLDGDAELQVGGVVVGAVAVVAVVAVR